MRRTWSVDTVGRAVHASDDDEGKELEVPYTHISALNVTKEAVPNTDQFAAPAEQLKPLGGSDVFKRRVARQIQKARKGVDGAASTQKDPDTEYTGYQMFDVVLPPYNLDYLAKLYESSPIHHAAVDAKVANIVGLGYTLVETNWTKRNFERIEGDEKKTKKARTGLEIMRDQLQEQLESFNDDDTLTETFVKVWRDYETMGNGYLEIGRKANGDIGYIGHIPAQTMRIRKKRDGFVQVSNYKLQFFANFGDNHDENGNWKPKTNPIEGGVPNEVIHVKKYSPTSSHYGVPDIVAASQAIAGNEFAHRFNLDYFENKAVPRHLIVMKGAKLGAAHEERLLAFFETGLKGQNHRSLFIPLPADTKETQNDLEIKPIEAGTQDSSFMNYRKANLSEILMVHRVPITKISITEQASLAIAKDADKTFKEQVCAPEQNMFAMKVNKIIKEMTEALELAFNEMTLTDADTQSKIDERRIKTGVDLPNEVRARDGKPHIKGGDERVDLNAKDKIAQAQAEERTQRERDSARSAGATDSAGAARTPKGEGRTTA
jgi:PBSX family phage portal protein